VPGAGRSGCAATRRGKENRHKGIPQHRFPVPGMPETGAGLPKTRRSTEWRYIGMAAEPDVRRSPSL